MNTYRIALNFVTLKTNRFLGAIVLAIAFMFFGPTAFAQKQFGAEDLKADLKELRQAVLDTHQNPFTYCTESDFEAAYDSACVAIADSMGRVTFAREVGKFLSVLKDSHCYLNYRILMKEHSSGGGHFVSFKVRSIDSTLYCYGDKEGLLPDGSTLISVNGHDATELFEVVSDYAMYEGDSQRGHLRISETIYPQLIAHLADIEEKNELVIRWASSGKIDTVLYPGRDLKYLKKRAKKNKPTAKQSLKINEQLSLGVLTIGSFNYKSSRYYNRFLRKSFARLDKADVENLVIDIRDNTGGKADRAEILYAYLAGKEINMPEYIIAKQSEVSMERNANIYKGFTKFAINHFFRKNEEIQHYLTMVHMEVGEVDTFYYSEPEAPKKRHRFEGNTYLLMNGKSGSASVNFASGFRQLGLGPVMGESCLGPESGTWGNPGSFKLPNTKLKVFLSTIRFGADGSFTHDPAPMQPDEHIPYNVEDMKNEVDTQLEYLKDLLRKPESSLGKSQD